MEYLKKLNDKQREAVLCTEGPLLILAGAGSGKTSTMTCRIAYLIHEKDVSPFSILAVTFTNKAAAEMRDRLEAIFSSIDEAYNVSGMWIRTFHSTCLRMLQYDADLLGYGKNFVVYDTTDQKTVIKNIIKSKSIDDKKFGPNYFLSAISDSKNRGENAKAYSEINGDRFPEKLIGEIFAEYENILLKNNAMDFDDLIINAVRLLEENPQVLEKYRRKFKYIMVDEYQDTNHIQYKFIKMLSDGHHNLCVVGDDDQCIYQWRGADIQNILDFEKDFPNTKVIKLEQNYRSYGNILNAAHSVISHNGRRKDKKLWTSKEAGGKIVYRRAETEREEAKYIAQEISLLKGRNNDDFLSSGLRYCDFAVLYRTNAQSRTFEEALRARGIKSRVVGNVGFYERKEIKDMLAYLRLVQNPADDLALIRVINEPKRGIGDKTVEKLKVLAQVRGESLLRALSDEEVLGSFPAKAETAVREMVTAIEEYSKEKENLRVTDIYDGLLVRTGYFKSLEDQNTVEAEGRIENLMELKSAMMTYEEKFTPTEEEQTPTLQGFLSQSSLDSSSDQEEDDDITNKVVLMTMHSAKGLEFPVVFVPGMEDGLFPGWRSLDSIGGIEEERRLCYVAMTRAKEKLYLTSAEQRTIYGKTDFTRESQFLREIDPNMVTGDGIYNKKEAKKDRSSQKGAYTDGFSGNAMAKPFDSLKYAKQAVRQAAEGNSINFEPGDRVNHAKFGEGMVVETAEKTVTVIFDSAGTKKLAKDLAPIKKI